MVCTAGDLQVIVPRTDGPMGWVGLHIVLVKENYEPYPEMNYSVMLCTLGFELDSFSFRIYIKKKQNFKYLRQLITWFHYINYGIILKNCMWEICLTLVHWLHYINYVIIPLCRKILGLGLRKLWVKVL